MFGFLKKKKPAQIMYRLLCAAKSHMRCFPLCKAHMLSDLPSKSMKSEGVYLVFHSARGKKFPNGNFWTTGIRQRRNRDCRKIIFRQSQTCTSYVQVSQIFLPLFCCRVLFCIFLFAGQLEIHIGDAILIVLDVILAIGDVNTAQLLFA